MDGLKVNGPQAPETKAADAGPADSRPSGGAAAPTAGIPFRRPSQRTAGRGYSRFVSMAKVGLVGSALALVALLAAWPTLKEIPQPRIGVERGQPEISRPRFISSDDANQPYSVTATRAQETPGQSNIVALEQPEAEMTENAGTWVTLRGDRGWYDRQTGILKMNGHVRILRDDGSELRTEEAFILVRDGTAWGDVYTEGQGPQGEVKAQGFRMKDRGKTMTFLNGSNANVTPSASAGPEAAPRAEPASQSAAPVPVPPVVAPPVVAPVAPPPVVSEAPAPEAPVPAVPVPAVPVPTVPAPAEPPAPPVAAAPPAALPAEPPVPAPAVAAAAGAAAAAAVAVPPPPPPKPAVLRAAPTAPPKAAAPAAVKKPQPAPAKPAAKPKRKP